MSSIRDLSYPHQQVIDAMKTQLLIVLVNRLGGRCDIPATEIDGIGPFDLEMAVVDDVFWFKVVKKGQ